MIGANVRDAMEDEFSYVVSISRIDLEDASKPNEHFCTGTLITRQDVLTSAHCMESEALSTTLVIVGSINLTEGITYKPLWWITYNLWTDMKEMQRKFTNNDIGNLRLYHEVPEEIVPASIMQMPNSNFYGLNVQIASWGDREDGVTPINMKTVILNILSNTECESRIKGLCGQDVPIKENRLCAVADPFALMYRGDSGAPLLYMGSVIAIHEATIPLFDEPFHPENVNVNIDISYYLNFIIAVTNTNFRYS
ncbi:PREDICTED: chymotrypsin-2-like [Ceratosolen solmsi marchali]|uniref:Chymotrypsin-2-like n=1 Tax=Ceratosolen solmsi marchali TaxID=326594 RepID=A0AAJ6VNB8_9HYME|nr:PREDICTED: chymotrypsin-2-like [Ceratosolen solmsi marchali]